VRRAFGLEILDHGSVDLSRAVRGLPLIVQHDHDGPLPVGRVRNISVDADRVMRGDLDFSKRAEAQAYRQDVIDEIITDVSVGYPVPTSDQITKRGDTYTVRNWLPVEVSLVSIAADDSVGINRGLETVNRAEQIRAAFQRFMARAGVRELLTRCLEDEAVTVEAAQAQLDAHLADNPEPAPDAELEIRRAFEPFVARAGVVELQTRMIGEKKTRAEAVEALLSLVGTAGNPPATPAASLSAGRQATEKFNDAAVNAILVRSGLANKEEREQGLTNEYTGYTMPELARAFCDVNRIDYAGLSRSALIGRAIDPGIANLETSDFAAILENVMNKALFRGFEQAETTWAQWCSTNTAPDFKAYTRPGVSQFTSLELVAEQGEIQDGIMVDKKEGAQLGTYARRLSVTREAMINDDLSAFSDAGVKMGQAADRTVDEVVYTLLTSNAGVGPDMAEDTESLFDATAHSNLVTAGAPPTEALVTAAKVAMAAQVDQNSILLGIRPRFMLVGIPLEETAIKLATAEYSPDGSANPFEPNSVRNTFVPVASARLPAAPWYMMGPQGTTCEVTFLNGNASPSLERDVGWGSFAMHWRVWIDFAALFVDWRAAYQNDGVT